MKMTMNEARAEADSIIVRYEPELRMKLQNAVRALETLVADVKAAVKEKDPVLAAKEVVDKVSWAIANLGLGDIMWVAGLLQTGRAKRYLLEHLEPECVGEHRAFGESNR